MQSISANSAATEKIRRRFNVSKREASMRGAIRAKSAPAARRAPAIRRAALAALLTVAAPSLAAAQADIAGTWQQIDDESNEVQSLVTIVARGGVYEGSISKLFLKPGDPPNPVCDACPGTLRNAPLVGLKIIENMRRAGDVYTGGTILDPDDGKAYSAELKLSPDGRELTVTGYIGVPLLGRSQVWKRAR
jgi:uncharacterized protein (DUF2147 family)